MPLLACFVSHEPPAQHDVAHANSHPLSALGGGGVLQFRYAPWHVGWHTPAEQDTADAFAVEQACAQAPQLAASVFVSTQFEPQTVVEQVHTPLSQVGAAADVQAG